MSDITEGMERAFDLGFEHAFHAGPKTDADARIVATLDKRELGHYQKGLRSGMAAKTPVKLRVVKDDTSASEVS